MTTANIPDLGAKLASLTDDAVKQVRKTGTLVCICDVLKAVTGYSEYRCRKLLADLEGRYDELLACREVRDFPGRNGRGAAATGTTGIVRLIRRLPGTASPGARKTAVETLGRYMGGDPAAETLVRFMGADPAGAHAATEDLADTHAEERRARDARMKSLTVAFQLAKAIGSSSEGRLYAESERLIDEVLLPEGDRMDEYLDAAAILRERDYAEDHIVRLASELGKALKRESQSAGRAAQSNARDFGPQERQVGLYHRVRDASLIEDVLQAFKGRALHSRVLAIQPRPWRVMGS